MGGAKKRSLAQADKQQKLQASKERKGQKAKSSKVETQSKDVFNIPELVEKDLKELQKIKALTLYSVATKCNVRLSTAKTILNMMENRNTIQKVASCGGRKVYRFVGTA